MKTTSYFDATRNRPDRLSIKDEWLTYAIENLYVVAFLVSDDARWVNGQTIQVNGGIL